MKRVFSRIVVRSKAIFCLDTSLIKNICDQKKKLLSKIEIDSFLKTACEEEIDYSMLLSYYKQSKKRINNELFAEAFVLNDCIAIGKRENNILVYYFQQISKLDKIIPWKYPHLISEFGVSNSSVKEILKDWNNLSFINYYIKNCVGSNISILNDHAIIRKNNEFEVDNLFVIKIDEHICVENNLNKKKQYIADSWWFSFEEIINDMLSISVLEFGIKYRAFWCA